MLNEDAKERSSRDNARTFRYPIRNICPRGPVRAVGTNVRRFDLHVTHLELNNEVKSRAIQKGEVEVIIINKLQWCFKYVALGSFLVGNGGGENKYFV